MTAGVLDLTSSNSPRQKATRFRITTLAAKDNLLLAGGFHGDYALLNLHSSSPTPIRGMISQAKNAITNHAHFFADRQSGQTRLYIASNDHQLRTLDCTTATVLNTHGPHPAVNCAATSPDSRLRVLVGDFPGSSIIDANTGSLVKQLPSSSRDAFACAWSDNGIHVATAAQDNRVFVWDARRWDVPLAIMPTELDCVRVLRFSPLAGGWPVLVAAEAADYVHVLDAISFGERQVLEFFGNVAGVTFDDAGGELVVANGDARFGGLMSWRRCGGGSLARPVDLFATEGERERKGGMRWDSPRRMVSEQWMGSVERTERMRGPLKECEDLFI
jgi:WD40 repeat protein